MAPFWHIGIAYMTPIITHISFDQDVWSPAEKKYPEDINRLMWVYHIVSQQDYRLYDIPMGKPACLQIWDIFTK